MFACDEPALVVDRVSVRIVGALSENGDLARFLYEAQHPVVGNVRPDEITAGRKPSRTLGPDRAGPVPGHPHVACEKLPEALVQHDKVRAFDLSVKHDFPPVAAVMLAKVGAFGAQG